MQQQTELFNQHRPRLFALAYRMLGSAMDADDIVQEAFLRWQRAPEQGIQSPQAYLSTIVTNLCLDHLQSARVRRETYVGPWLPEPLLIEQNLDPTEAPLLAESLTTAFLVLLESLAPLERAIFLLRDVFDYEYAEIAAMVGKSEANCRQLLHRARSHIAAGRQRFNSSRAESERVTQQFLDACARGDLQGLMATLAIDVVWQSDGGGKVKAAIQPVVGPSKVARLIFGLLEKIPSGYSQQIVQVNGSMGIIGYVNGQPFMVISFAVANERIQDIHVVLNPDKLNHIPPV